MAKYNVLHNSFSSGELGPQLAARTDSDQYKQGVQEMSNFIVGKQGGAFRRMGSEFGGLVPDVAYSAFSNTIIPFKGADEDFTIFISMNGETSDAGFTLAPVLVIDRSFTVITPAYPSATLATLFEPLQVDFDTSIDASKLKYHQIGDEVLIYHQEGDIQPFRIRRTASALFQFIPMSYGKVDKPTSFSTSLNPVTITKSIVRATPWLPQNTDTDIRLEPSLTGGVVGKLNVTGTAATLTAKNGAGTPISFFTANMVGSLFAVDQGATAEGVFLCSSLTSSSVMAGYILVNFTNTTAFFSWSESVWSNFRGWPRAGAFYQGRQHYGGQFADPNAYYASDVGDLDLFMNRFLNQDTASDFSNLEHFGPTDAADPFRRGLLTNILNEIRWMINDGDLRIGTRTGDFKVSFSQDQAEGYGPLNFQIDLQSGVDSSGVQPFLGDAKVLYINGTGRKVRSIDNKTGDFQYRNIDLSVIADHMSYNPINSITASDAINSSSFLQSYWQESASTLWLLNSRKTLIGLTINQESEVTAWHQHVLGGDGTHSIEGIAGSYDRTTNIDELILLVKRTINSNSVLYLERIGETFNHTLLNNPTGSDADNPTYLDSWIRISQASSTTVGGLAHLEGETVSALYDGKIATGLTVSSNQLILPTAAEHIIIGYPYKSKINSLVLDAGQQFGSSRGNKSRVDRITVSLYNSSAGLIGSQDGVLDDIEIDPTTTFSGDTRVELSQTSDSEPRVTIETNKPVPLNILGWTTRGVSYDG